MSGSIQKVFDSMESVIADPGLSWEQKYDLIFSDAVSRRLFDFCKKHGLTFEYYDPDTTYEDDVMAFVHAARDIRHFVLSAERVWGD